MNFASGAKAAFSSLPVSRWSDRGSVSDNLNTKYAATKTMKT
ncbi:hypothetical protein AB395_00002355 [Sinorhizobium fredii CCBAU 45436]|nr:hypothetical protein SF83666_c23890 [Sinorhizobium fredii CCBAU 83666]AWI58007.1 hypothetical protein AB395_00002355 [Sinorhizobium fredii CCBAU 45436]AWM25835.1 hypothetical protein AOX55_00002585 [Sinorhizobium fredii CCBAU 25509]